MSDHDPYDPTYYRLGINGGDVVAKKYLANAVLSACYSYLSDDNHHANMNKNIQSVKIPTVSNWTEYYNHYLCSKIRENGIENPCQKWGTEISSVIVSVKNEIDSFFTKTDNKSISADTVFNFMADCFYYTNRIAEQRFQYFKTDGTKKTVYGIGLSSKCYVKKKSTYRSQLGHIKDSASIKKDENIVAINVQKALHEFMKYNADSETVYNYGQMNLSQTRALDIYISCWEGTAIDEVKAKIAEARTKEAEYRSQYGEGEFVEDNSGSRSDYAHITIFWRVKKPIIRKNTKRQNSTRKIHTAQYSLACYPNEQGYGTVSPSSKQSGKEFTVTCTAYPNPGYFFENWDNGETSQNITVKVNDDDPDVYLIANFEVQKFKITLMSDNPEYGQATSDYSQYEYGKTAKLIAQPFGIYEFLKWEDSDRNEYLDNPLIIENVTRDMSFKAYFQEKHYTVELTCNRNGTVSGGGSYTVGEKVTITATPDSGYKFRTWMDQDGVSHTENPFTFSINKNMKFTAYFEEITGCMLSHSGSSGSISEIYTLDHQSDQVYVRAKDEKTNGWARVFMKETENETEIVYGAGKAWTTVGPLACQPGTTFYVTSSTEQDEYGCGEVWVGAPTD